MTHNTFSKEDIEWAIAKAGNRTSSEDFTAAEYLASKMMQVEVEVVRRHGDVFLDAFAAIQFHLSGKS